MWLVGIAALLFASFGCGKQAEPAGTGEGGAHSGSGGTLETWPYQLYLSPNNRANYGVQVDDKYVYWNTSARIMRALKNGEGEPGELIVCPCELLPMVAEHGYLYLHTSAAILRVDRETGAAAQVDLLWDHLREGPLLVEPDHIYTAMPGCAAITRIDKQSMTFDPEADVMFIETEYPRNAGRTLLARAGSRLVCGAPERLFVIDEWGGPAQNVREGVNHLAGLIAVGEDVYWMEGGAFGRIGEDGQAVVLATGALTATRKLNYVPGRERLVWGQGWAPRSFSLRAMALDPEVPELFGSSNDLATDDEAAYATASQADPDPEVTYRNWIARIPFEEFIPPD